MRNAILHFRSVGATSIEDQMASYSVNFLSTVLGFSEKSVGFLESKIRPEMIRKFDYDISKEEYFEIPRPALLIALQQQVSNQFN
jgi:hypothetical protein